MKSNEIQPVIWSDTEEEIVVTATMREDGITSWFMDMDRSRSQNPVLQTYQPLERTGISVTPIAPGGANDAGITSSVNVTVPPGSPNFDEAMRAAENLAKTLAKLESVLNDLPANYPLNWGNRQTTAGTILAEMHNTRYIVTEVNDFENGGVGGAQRGTGGAPNTDTLYFEPFDGDNGPDGTSNDYADPRYTQGEGMIAIMLHELGHMSSSGLAFDQSSKAHYRQEHGSYDGYVRSEYWYNNEAFANSFATDIGTALGFNVSDITFSMYGGINWVEPSQIYADHTYQMPVRGLDDLFVIPQIV